MTEEVAKNLFNEPISRRKFLRGLVKGGAVLAGASVGLAGCSPDSPEPRQTPAVQSKAKISQATPTAVPPTPTPEPSPTKEPVRFLTEEELQKARIKIYQTSDVTLRVERGIFDFPIFKDALEGQLNEVVIVLVDHSQMSWRASEKLPEDAKMAWQAVHMHPKEYPDEFWKSKREYTEKVVKLLKEKLQVIQERADSNTDPKLKYFFENLIFNEKSSIFNYEQSLFFLRGGRENLIWNAEERGILWPDGESVGEIVRLDADYDLFPTPEIRKMFQDFPETAKRFKELKEKHPELFGKAFIYCVVGGDQKPEPKQSYPKPEQFIENSESSKDKKSYRYFLPQGFAGPTLRHELSHYITDSRSADEYEADTKMFDSIEAAWKKKQAGNESGYPFHFFTKEGETITKKQQTSQGQLES